VDSAPQDSQAFEVARHWGVHYLLEPLPGVSRARNVGARACDSDIVAMLDDEAIADPDWLKGLAGEFEDADVMVVAGRIKDFEAHTEEERLCAALATADCGDARRVIDKSVPLWFERACFGGVGNGGNLAFRRHAFDIWPGFCESLGAGARIVGGEEHYAFFTLVDLGFRVVYSPDAVVRHPFPLSMRALRARQHKYLSASVGYIALLFFNQPRYRARILKYLLEAIRGIPRPWRGGKVADAKQTGSGWSLRAMGAGLYYFMVDRVELAMRKKRRARAYAPERGVAVLAEPATYPAPRFAASPEGRSFDHSVVSRTGVAREETDRVT
jgi:glycosyltransferase involved in cell wall biosynthesis